MERLVRPLLLLFLITVSSVVLSVQFTNQEINNLKVGIPKEEKINEKLLGKIGEMVKGYPMEKMVTQIARKDEILAAYLVGIAKKESNWGRRVPVLEGEDCYNYWGYRGVRERMGSAGHTCFESPTDAVETVSKRLSYFIQEKGLENPEDLIVWKCGSNCDGHSQESVEKWITDVGYYYEQVLE